MKKAIFLLSLLVLFIALLVVFHPNTNQWVLYGRTFNYWQHQHGDYIAPQLTPSWVSALLRIPEIRHISKWFMRQTLAISFVNYLEARTRFFDQEVERAINSSFKQIVIVASGFDTRAYRFHKEGTRFFEVDLPSVVKSKQIEMTNILNVTISNVVYVGANLIEISLKQALEETKLLDQNEPTLFLVEGLLYYIPEEAVRSLLRDIAIISPQGSRLVFDSTVKCILENPGCRENYPGSALITNFLNFQGEFWRFGVGIDRVGSLLEEYGFSIQRLLSAEDIHREYFGNAENEQSLSMMYLVSATLKKK